jgi:RHS repeat-associated protein
LIYQVAWGKALGVSEAEYNANNQLTEWGTASLYYDANGNMISDGVNSYTWNARNQLGSMNFGANSFQYDAYGRRVSKTISSTATNYLYDGANIVQELSGTTPTANLLSGGIDEVFTRTDSNGTANFLTDALGSAINLTDSSGNSLAQYAYDPFGNTFVTSGSSANLFQYTGRENDGTGVYYYRERFYSPILNRFLSEDPIQYAGGFNFYTYVGGDPVSRVDPLGLCWIYVQSTGAMFSDYLNSGIVVYVGTAYSGSPQRLNRASDQFIPNTGPIPQGTYGIGPEQTNQICANCGLNGQPINLLNSMRLTPDPGNNMGNPTRFGFLLHGGDMTKKNSSQGCIVLPLEVRNTMGTSGDNCLEVVP